jgi:hypothetical protein
MRIHEQRIYRTNGKTNIGYDCVFNGLVDNDAHFLILDFRY